MAPKNICCYRDCSSAKSTNPDLYFHHAPKDPVRRREWFKASGNEDLITQGNFPWKSNFLLCSKHFSIDDYRYKIPPFNTKLHNKAIPQPYTKKENITPNPSNGNILQKLLLGHNLVEDSFLTQKLQHGIFREKVQSEQNLQKRFKFILPRPSAPPNRGSVSLLEENPVGRLPQPEDTPDLGSEKTNSRYILPCPSAKVQNTTPSLDQSRLYESSRSISGPIVGVIKDNITSIKCDILFQNGEKLKNSSPTKPPKISEQYLGDTNESKTSLPSESSSSACNQTKCTTKKDSANIKSKRRKENRNDFLGFPDASIKPMKRQINKADKEAKARANVIKEMLTEIEKCGGRFLAECVMVTINRNNNRGSRNVEYSDYMKKTSMNLLKRLPVNTYEAFRYILPLPCVATVTKYAKSLGENIDAD